METDVTVGIKLQPKQGWGLMGRYRGRNVNVICFAFLKELFQKSFFTISAGQAPLCLGVSAWERVLSDGLTGVVCSQAPGKRAHLL